jgi:o-succinylbenzoate synthase
LRVSSEHIKLDFKFPAGTSRGILKEKSSWIIRIHDKNKIGIGEVSVIEGLSPEFNTQQAFERNLKDYINKFETCLNENFISETLMDYFIKTHPSILAFPSIIFGFESAYLDFKNGGKQIYFDNDFTAGKTVIPINGLVWMGNESFMQEQLKEKIEIGFTTIKMKVGAIDWFKELKIIDQLRENYSKNDLTIRLDANGAFKAEEVKQKLHQLRDFEIHSIEQPIKRGQWQLMKELCEENIIPIALDEELIGIIGISNKIELLETIMPHYIILKPSLHGGFSGTKEWIELADQKQINWWITSALESNVGLNAICQFAANYPISIPQGLGTGGLYLNNFPSDLAVDRGFIFKQRN